MVGVINSLTKAYLSVYSRFMYFRYSAKYQAGLNPEDVIKQGFKDVPESGSQLQVKAEAKVEQVTKGSIDKAIS